MSGSSVRIPGPDHPITVEPSPGRVVVTAGGTVVANSATALCLREASYPPVHYIPRGDVDMAALERTATVTHCPYKGDASYYAVRGGTGGDVAWSYEAPHAAVAAIAGHLAFYGERVDAIALPERD
ncbi:MAG: DUF427 domain-containing protein [Gluconacetobacter diazotrophicus]|nr:DUF427 domain-containing protein [Gluconacetobacter diazotrophicus]